MRRRPLVALKEILTAPDLITYGNLLFGLGAMYSAFLGKFSQASVFMLISVICDSLDGKMAGLLNRKTEFGKELDSLADAISFGIAPAVFGYFWYEAKIAVPSSWLLGFIVFFVMCGVTRLARYNINADGNEFRGVPITVNGVLFPALFFIGVPSVLPILFIGMGLLMISGIRIKRLF